MIKLTERQRYIVTDLKDQETMCVEKYERSAKSAKDPVLKELFGELAKDEQRHCDSLDQLLQGKVPPVDNKCRAEKEYSPAATYTGKYMQEDKDNDKFLCTDAITTEKYVASAYNYDLFHFADPEARRLLNDIQTEEQVHAEKIYKYKTVNQMT